MKKLFNLLLITLLLSFTSCSEPEPIAPENKPEVEDKATDDDKDDLNDDNSDDDDNNDNDDNNNDDDNDNDDQVIVEGSVVATYGDLKVKGNKITDKNGNAIQLRGMSLFWSQWMGQFYTSGTVKWLKDDWKATIVRAAMGVEDNGGYLTNKEREKNKVFTVIDAAIAQGIYVIVDWHSHHAEDHTNEAIAFFSEVAEKYGDTPNIIYETYNEPLNVSWTGVLKPYHEKVIEAIRKHDPDNLIICGTRTWSQRVDEVVNNKIDDPNVAYTLHYYSSTHRQNLRNYAQTALNNNIPIFVTEYGVSEASGNGTIDVNEAKVWWKFLDDNKISWCNWSVADKVEASAALKPGASGNGGWTESQLTQSGKMIRDEMRAKNQDFK